MKFLIKLSVTKNGTELNVLCDEEIERDATKTEPSLIIGDYVSAIPGIKGYTGVLDEMLKSIQCRVDKSGIAGIVGESRFPQIGVADCDLHSLSDDALLLETMGRFIESFSGDKQQSLTMELRRRAKLKSR